jgi:chromosome segregation ATPase
MRGDCHTDAGKKTDTRSGEKQRRSIMRTKKEEYIEKMTADLKEWSATINELEDRASRTAVGLESGYDERIRNLKEKRDLILSRLRELEEATGDAWRVLMDGVETAKHEFRDAFDAAKDDFRKVA